MELLVAVPAGSKFGKKNSLRLASLTFDGTPARKGTLVTKGSGVSMRVKSETGMSSESLAVDSRPILRGSAGALLFATIEQFDQTLLQGEKYDSIIRQSDHGLVTIDSIDVQTLTTGPQSSASSCP